MARPPAKPRPAADSPGLSRARVCQEALALVDDEGLEALSMRRLGARLGVEAMSLYRYVRDKADLLDALHVAVLADLSPVDVAGGELSPAHDDSNEEDDWRILLGGLARSLRAAMLRHPHVAALFVTRPVNAPEAIATIESARDALVAAGFTVADADRAVVEVGIFTVGHALAEANGRAPTHERSPKQAGPAEFRFGLEALLHGIGRHRQPPPQKQPQKRRRTSHG